MQVLDRFFFSSTFLSSDFLCPCQNFISSVRLNFDSGEDFHSLVASSVKKFLVLILPNDTGSTWRFPVFELEELANNWCLFTPVSHSILQIFVIVIFIHLFCRLRSTLSHSFHVSCCISSPPLFSKPFSVFYRAQMMCLHSEGKEPELQFIFKIQEHYMITQHFGFVLSFFSVRCT